MKSKSTIFFLSAVLVIFAGIVVVLVNAGSTPEAARDSHRGVDIGSGAGAEAALEGGGGGVPDPETLEDRPLEEYQEFLLDLAFRTASKMPVYPQIKARSRYQEKVVGACLELDQPGRALRYLQEIENWRRGAALADLAFYCARNDLDVDVQPLLDLAQGVAEEAARNPVEQAWRVDRIRVKIGRTHAWLGQEEEAARFGAGVVDSESGKIEAVEAMRTGTEQIDEELAWVDDVVGTGSFDAVRNALWVLAERYGSVYEDEEARARVQEKIRSSWSTTPRVIRIELLMRLAELALEHEDAAEALGNLDDAKRLVENGKWIPEDYVPMVSDLAKLRYRAGDEERARELADTALAEYDEHRERIVNIYRAEALLPLAELNHLMGDAKRAAETYARAVEEAVVNANSRPRAEDITAACLSMALHEVEPPKELRARLSEIHDALGPPW